jgi:DNA-binding transcriptional LysR family regulator
MHIESLKMFCDLAQLRSFSKTAEKHLISQSAVSQQIAQLELEHKCQLIERKRPIELTAAGELFYKAAKEIVDRYEQLKSELHSLGASGESRINIAAIFSIGMHSLPSYIKKFMMNYPNVNAHIEYMSAEKVYEQVLTGVTDIGIVAVPKKDKRLDVYNFEDELLVVVCSPKHSLASESQVDIHKLRFEKFISFEANIPTRTWIDDILQRYNVTVRSVMEFDNIETIKRAVEINSGISILPEATVAQEAAAGTLRAIRFSNENFFRPTGIIVRKDRTLSQAGRYFIELLRKR